jgi:predicted AlkP superfamily pyrophosphatase or phosphodiesterase
MISFRALALLLLANIVTPLGSAQTPGKALLLISIDGMHPDYLLRADEFKLKIPILRRILREGSHASGVRSVLPTVTYPSHTTILTGVWPVKHGIFNNVTFDPLEKNLAGWYWYAEDIRVPTLWQAASKAGYVTGSVSWPVSVGAPGVQYDIPEVWRAETADDFKLLRAVATPRLQTELQKYAGPYVMDLDNAIPGDRARARYASAMVLHKGVRFLTLHLASLDHLEHAAGPYSARAFEALEEIDNLVGQVEQSFQEAKTSLAVCIVSDHGFARTDHALNLNVAFVKAGLMTPNPKRSARAPGISDWKAEPWMAGGSAAIVLKDPKDGETAAKVEQLLRALAADPDNGIAAILDAKAIEKLGGPPNAIFVVDMRPGYALGSAMDGPLVRSTKVSGTHGYAPTHPELLASFVIAGPGIRKGADLGEIDMRSIAPTLAKYLQVSLPAADLPALDLTFPSIRGHE